MSPRRMMEIPKEHKVFKAGLKVPKEHRVPRV